MTDDRRLEIERRFDGEPAGVGRPEPFEGPLDDPEDHKHRERLARLRDLARRHDPASEVPQRAFVLPDSRSRRSRWWLAVAATAAAVALLIGRVSRVDQLAPVVVVVPSEKSAVRPTEVAVERPPLEVELYGWANTPSRASQQAARLILGPGSPSKKRSPADEILALELANAALQPRGGVQRFAVSKGSKSATAPKSSLRARSS